MGTEMINKEKGSTWQSWHAMNKRCRDKRDANYGGRGIRVCDRWTGRDGFSNFLLDMGERPSGMTLDRIDVDGDYAPSNCRWACPAEQARNTRRNILITYQGRTQILEDWAREVGINWTTLYERIHTCGWTVERALQEKVTRVGNRTAHGSPRRRLKPWERAAARAKALEGEGFTTQEIAALSMVSEVQIRAWMLTGYSSVAGGRRHQLLPAQVERVERALDILEARAAAGNTVPMVGVSDVRAA